MSRTLDPLYNSPVHKQALHLAHLEHEKHSPLIRDLYRERESSVRKSQFQKVAILNMTLFQAIRALIEQRHVYAVDKSFKSVLELVSRDEEKRVYWKNISL